MPFFSFGSAKNALSLLEYNQCAALSKHNCSFSNLTKMATTKLTLWATLCVLTLAGLFSGCQSSKIAYGNSYYFKQTPKPVAEKPKATGEVVPLSDELQVSREQLALAQRNPNALIEQAQRQLLAAVEETDNEKLKESASRMNRTANEMKGQELTKKEIRAKRKELRKEMQTLAKEYRNMAPNKTNDLDQNLRISLILLVAGLVLLIIPTALTIIVGSLAFIAGLIFLIVWLVTEA